MPCLVHAQGSDDLNTQVENYLSQPLLIKPVLANVTHIPYMLETVRNQADNDLIHIIPRPFLVNLMSYNNLTNQVVMENPPLLTAYQNAIQSLPPPILNNKTISDWLSFKSAYVTQTKYFYMPKYGSFVVLTSCEDSFCNNILAGIYNPISNTLMGFISIQENPTQTYIFGAQTQADLSLVLLLKAFSANPDIINIFYASFTAMTSKGIPLSVPTTNSASPATPAPMGSP